MRPVNRDLVVLKAAHSCEGPGDNAGPMYFSQSPRASVRFSTNGTASNEALRCGPIGRLHHQTLRQRAVGPETDALRCRLCCWSAFGKEIPRVDVWWCWGRAIATRSDHFGRCVMAAATAGRGLAERRAQPCEAALVVARLNPAAAEVTVEQGVDIRSSNVRRIEGHRGGCPQQRSQCQAS